MKRTNFNRKIIYTALGIVITSLGLFLLRHANAVTSDGNLVNQENSIPSTPNIDSLSQSEKPIPTVPTQSVSRIIDLAKGFQAEDEFVFTVLHSNGKYEEYYIPATYSGNEKELMNLGAGDKIVTGYPLKPIISTPVIEAPKKDPSISEPYLIGNPYQVPSATFIVTPTQRPYP